jgi:hypothetical protein
MKRGAKSERKENEAESNKQKSLQNQKLKEFKSLRNLEVKKFDQE